VALDAVATAHTLDDQAETVLAKILRGAWTEGLSGIHPKLESPEGPILRPLLSTTRAEIEAFLSANGQSWREDSTNRHLTFTRNRIRHELLPQLEDWNPRIRAHLAQMAILARDEESWWKTELARIAPQIVRAGRPVRGGGRAASDGLAIDVTRLSALAPALQRRLLRYVANQLGRAPDFAATEALLALALTGRAGQRLGLAGCIRAERTPRELRLTVQPPTAEAQASIPEYTFQIPGEIQAPAFNLCLRIDQIASPQQAIDAAKPQLAPPQVATLRNWRPGDRVKLRHSSAPRKVKEVLERLRVTGSSRALWPVLELDKRIIWMRGVDLEPVPGIEVLILPSIQAGAPHPDHARSEKADEY
jgi:tRNA(Ile)-lysidine synthase